MLPTIMKDTPEIIYKYRNWTSEFHKKVLTENQLFLSSPSDFNDPFDCRNSKNHLLLDTPEKIENYIENHIKNRMPEHSAYLMANGYDLENERNLLRERLKDLPKYQKEFEIINEEYTDKYLGVLSLSGRWDSILMWSHYGDFHKGYCVGFDEEKLKNSRLFGKGGNVNYDDKFPTIDPFDDNIAKTSFYQTHWKAKEWEYEEEYRLTKLFFDKPDEKPQRAITLPEDCIREVIIGMKTTEEQKEEIIKICRNKNVPVFQTYKDSLEFKVKRQLI